MLGMGRGTSFRAHSRRVTYFLYSKTPRNVAYNVCNFFCDMNTEYGDPGCKPDEILCHQEIAKCRLEVVGKYENDECRHRKICDWWFAVESHLG